jgi:hypothetical protein
MKLCREQGRQRGERSHSVVKRITVAGSQAPLARRCSASYRFSASVPFAAVNVGQSNACQQSMKPLINVQRLPYR